MTNETNFVRLGKFSPGTPLRNRHRDPSAVAERYARLVAAGGAYCARCSLPIVSGDRWDLDHRDDRVGYLGPSRRTCNRAAGQAASMARRPDAHGGAVAVLPRLVART